MTHLTCTLRFVTSRGRYSSETASLWRTSPLPITVDTLYGVPKQFLSGRSKRDDKHHASRHSDVRASVPSFLPVGGYSGYSKYGVGRLKGEYEI